MLSDAIYEATEELIRMMGHYQYSLYYQDELIKGLSLLIQIQLQLDHPKLKTIKIDEIKEIIKKKYYKELKKQNKRGSAIRDDIYKCYITDDDEETNNN